MRALRAAKLANLKLGGNQYMAPPIGGASAQAAAELLNIGVRSVERAKAVIKHGIPELQRALCGSCSRAERSARRKPPDTMSMSGGVRKVQGGREETLCRGLMARRILRCIAPFPCLKPAVEIGDGINYTTANLGVKRAAAHRSEFVESRFLKTRVFRRLFGIKPGGRNFQTFLHPNTPQHYSRSGTSHPITLKV